MKLVSKRQLDAALQQELTFTNYVHEFDADQDVSDSPKRLGIQHWYYNPLNCPVVLLDDVVEVFDLPNHNRGYPAGIDAIHGCFVGTALANDDLLGNTAGLHRFVQETHGCGLIALSGKQEVNRFALLVYRAV